MERLGHFRNRAVLRLQHMMQVNGGTIRADRRKSLLHALQIRAAKSIHMIRVDQVSTLVDTRAVNFRSCPKRWPLCADHSTPWGWAVV